MVVSFWTFCSLNDSQTQCKQHYKYLSRYTIWFSASLRHIFPVTTPGLLNFTGRIDLTFNNAMTETASAVLGKQSRSKKKSVTTDILEPEIEQE